MPTAARAAFNTSLEKGNGANPEVFTRIAEVKDISGPAGRRLFEEATNMDSPGGWAEWVPTTLEAGDVTFQLNLLQDNVTHRGLVTDRDSGTLRNWRLVHPSGTRRISFSGYVQEIGHESPVKGIQMTPVSIKITGPIVHENHP